MRSNYDRLAHAGRSRAAHPHVAAGVPQAAPPRAQPAAAAAAPDDLLYALRLAARRPGNARTVASLMRAIDGFRPRAGSIMTDRELGQIIAPTMFCLATGDPFLSPAQARPAIARIPGAVLQKCRAGTPLAGRSCWLRQARDQPPHRDRIRACRLGQAACGALRYGRWTIRIFIAEATWPGGPSATSSRRVRSRACRTGCRCWQPVSTELPAGRR